MAIILASFGGILSRFSMVRYEMQRRESITPGAIIAPVGQASTHLVQAPQTLAGLWLGFDQAVLILGISPELEGGLGAKGSPKSMVVIISERKTHEPNSGVMSMAFLPMRPMPACSARARSRIGPVST